MIEGIKIEMPTQVLREHMLTRIAFHKEKQAFYEKQSTQLKEGGLGPQNQSNDPVSSLEASGRRHAARAGFFEVLRDGLVEGETYRLDENDLEKLEITASRW